jgi:hypothetical protein
MSNYIDNVIITLKLKMGGYSKQSDAYKEMLYAVEMLECAKGCRKKEKTAFPTGPESWGSERVFKTDEVI